MSRVHRPKTSRWAQHGCQYTSEFMDKVKSLRDNESSSDPCKQFASKLLDMMAKQSSQQEAKQLVEVLGCLQLLPHTDGGTSAALTIVCDIFFLGHATQHHKQLLSAVKQLPLFQQDQFAEAIEHRIYLELARQEKRSPANQQRMGTLIECLHSLLDDPIFCKILVSQILPIGQYLVAELLQKPASGEMELESSKASYSGVQPIIACLYSIVQKHGQEIKNASSAGHAFLVKLSTSLMDLLKEECLLAEGLRATAVTLWRTLTLLDTDSATIASMLKGLIRSGEGDRFSKKSEEHDCPVEGNNGQMFTSEVAKLPALSRSCMVNGVLSTLEEHILLYPLSEEEEGVQSLALSDGVIEYACSELRLSGDERVKHYAVATLTTAIQQISKPTQHKGPTTSSCKKLEPLDLEAKLRIVQALLFAIQQDQKHIHAAFDAVMEMHKGSNSHGQCLAHDRFLEQSISNILNSGSLSKTAFAALSSISSHFGPLFLLESKPNLVWMVLDSMNSAALCSPAANFLQTLILLLKSTEHALERKEDSQETFWHTMFLRPVLQSMQRGGSSLRSSIAIHVLPGVFKVDRSSINFMLRIQVQDLQFPTTKHTSYTDQLATLLALLKASRSFGLFDSLEDIKLPGGDNTLQIPLQLLQDAVHSRHEDLREAVLQLVCIHPKLTLAPGGLEMHLAAEAVILGVRNGSSGLRNKYIGLLIRLIQRAVIAVKASSEEHPVSPSDRRSVHSFFLKWLSSFLVGSLYPGSPFPRKVFAASLLYGLVLAWQHDGEWTASREVKAQRTTILSPSKLNLSIGNLQVFDESFASRQGISALLEGIVDSWDLSRDLIESILMRLPAPLPGHESNKAVIQLLKSAKNLLASVQLHKADAGARLVRIIFRKYVLGLHSWSEDVSTSSCASASQKGEPAGLASSAKEFLKVFSDMLQANLDAAKTSLDLASKTCIGHGSLLAIKYIIGDLFQPEAGLMKCTSSDASFRAYLRSWLEVILELTEELMSVVLPILTLDEDAYLGAEDVCVDDQFNDSLSDGEAPSGQAITTACWLTLKEASLLLGTLAQKAPTAGYEQGVFTIEDLERISGSFLHILPRLKHNGATGRCIEGFVAVSERILREPALQALPLKWLRDLMIVIQRPGQTLSDINRRSAAIPLSFMAIFLAEPEGSQRILLRTGMKDLMLLAARTDCGPYPVTHALNTMATVFLDKVLSNDIQQFVTEGMRLTLQLLTSPQWQVRNAAGLCFSALTVRVLGFKNSKRGVAINCQQLFQRYPQLHALLLTHLEEAVKQNHGSFGSVPPCLFPILAIFVRLEPLPDMQGGLLPDQKDYTAYKRVFALLTQSPVMPLRQFAAKASVALIPSSDFIQEAEAYIETLSSGPLNQVHGRLFQIEALLKAEKLHRGPNSQIALQRNAFDLLLQGIQESPHPAIQAAYLDVCRLALQNPPQNRKLEDEIPLRQKSAASRTGQTQSNSEILDLTNQAIRNKAISGLRKVAKAILELPEQAGSVSGFSPPGLSEIRLNQLKSSPMLSKLVRSARACLDENLPEDADSAMTQLQKLALTKESETSSGKQSSSGADRPKLVDATRMRNPIDGSEGALESSENSSQQCGLISPLSLDGSDESKDEGSHMTKGSRPNLSPSEAERFLLATAEQVRPNHPVGVRLAAQRRLNNSGLFDSPSTYTSKQKEVQLRAWLISLSLLEDEDKSIRLEAAATLGKALPSIGGQHKDRACLEHVQKAVWYQMTQKFQGSQTYLQFLLDSIWRKQEDLVIQEDCRLYSREQDNAHEEPMLIAQLAAQNLSLMLSQNTLNKESLARILLWLTTALQVLLEWCDRQNPANKLQCIGGSTNQPSIFHNLVCMILGISACARSPHFGSESSTVLRGLGAVGNVLDEDCHPLVSKLLEIATRLWTDSNQLYSQESDFNTQLFLVPPNPLEAVM